MARMRIFFNRRRTVSAADVAGGVFIAQRDLLKSLRAQVLAGSGLTSEIAEILVELFLAGSQLSSPEHVDAEGYVSFRDLLAALGYSPGLLSRRIGWLCQRRWAETKRAVPNIAQGVHGNCQKVRITELGKGIIAPVWQKYEKLAERLLDGIPPSDLAVHHRINQLISDKLRAPQSWMDESRKAVAPKKPASAPEPAPRKYLLEPQSEFLD
jgi:DNA-binding MarR family transcriptional regulator